MADDVAPEVSAGRGDDPARAADRQPPYERLSALDAVFVHAESERTPLHIGAVVILEGGPLVDEHGDLALDVVRRHVEARLDRIPRFRRRLAFVPAGQGRPVWVDDEDFDIARHVRVRHLPPPGDRAQLLALAEELHMQVLDRRHPLWEMWFVTGLEGGRVAMIDKLHHALVDGVSGVDVATAMFDLEPLSPESPAPWTPRPAPSDTRLLVESLAQRLTEPVELARSARALLRTPGRLVRQVRELAGAASTFLTPAVLARPTSLNRPVGPRRSIATVDRSLEELKEVRAALGGTVNDVVLTGVAGGVRRLFELRGEPVDGVVLQGLTPVSLRRDDERLGLGNRVAGYLSPLPVGIADPVERLHTVSAIMRDRKARHQEEVTELLLDTANLLPPALPAILSRLIHRQPFINMVVTNVPGPPFELWFMGARIEEMIPVVPLGGNLSLGIAVLSYNGHLVLGLHVDPDLVPDVDVLSRAIDDELDLLVEAAASAGEEGAADPAPGEGKAPEVAGRPRPPLI